MGGENLTEAYPRETTFGSKNQDVGNYKLQSFLIIFFDDDICN